MVKENNFDYEKARNVDYIDSIVYAIICAVYCCNKEHKVNGKYIEEVAIKCG